MKIEDMDRFKYPFISKIIDMDEMIVEKEYKKMNWKRRKVSVYSGNNSRE